MLIRTAWVLFLSTLLTYCRSYTPSVPEIAFKFNSIRFTDNNENYNKTCCMPAGIKLNSTSSIFISVPRWKPDYAPSTLNVVVNCTDDVLLLQPFPTADENDVTTPASLNDPKRLKSVLGFEIDLYDNVWALDQGRMNDTVVPGSMKLNKYFSNGTLADSYDLSRIVDNEATSFLNDLVIDYNGGFVYITDSGIPTGDSKLGPNPGLIVINTTSKNITKVLYNDTSVLSDPSLWVTINGQHVVKDAPMQTGADAIGLSCDKKTLYYTALTSRNLYAISTQVLQQNPPNISNYVIELGYKYTASDGIMCSQNGRLYLTGLELNSILLQPDITATPENFQFNEFTHLIHNSTSLVWPDTLAFDNANLYLYVVANQLQNFVQNLIDFDQPQNGEANFYIWKMYVNDKSYLEDCIYVAPTSEDSDFPLWAIILVVIVLIIVIIIAGCAIRNYILLKKKRERFL
jgi:Major royal jelly protein